MNKLTKKQETFAQAVLTKSTLSNAYRVAYDCDDMTAKTINEKASIEANKDKVRARIDELRDRVEKAGDIDLNRIDREQGIIAFSDITDCFNLDFTLKTFDKIPHDTRRAISKIKVKTFLDKKGDEVKEVEVILLDKGKALDALTRRRGGYEKDNQQKSDIYLTVAEDKVEGIDDSWMEDS